jgi:hypothetical protein
MTAGPIEFMGEEAPHTVPATEMGGKDGLIQPKFPAGEGGLSGEGIEGHELDESESAQVRARRAGVPLLPSESGLDFEEPVVDPITGRTVPEDMVSGDVTGDGGVLSDLKP